MNTKFLIDAIVHQTTVLIAQLSTASGIRAPLSHVADQVFLELSREIEAQGISRKVVADMFGLAIRTYQKKVQRVTESVTARDRTLWQAVLEYLQEQGSCSRRELQARFDRDDPIVVGSVLNDLVNNGLVYKTGSGEGALFGITHASDLARAVREQRRESLQPVVLVLIYRAGSATRAALQEQLGVDEAALITALDALEASGQIERTGEGPSASYRAQSFVVPMDSEHGWEAAVFDHFQAVVRAIGTKLRLGVARAKHHDMIGGATLGFDIRPGHPHHDEVLGLLRRVRAEVNEVWERVQAYNAEHPMREEERTEVLFYFGQCVTSPDEE
ncbi:MAG TPA: MarR family transcriptional regulator [Polyangiales bacterium]|nr:MarR family transcriptional regulator [Polyangiales bacterium]